MITSSKIKVFILISWLALLSGCATSRSVIDIPLPISESSRTSKNKYVYINSVNDKRIFEVAPTEPNLPSLDPSEKNGSDIQLRAIGRKRGSSGIAWGDIVLPEGKTVESLINAALRASFIDNGYEVITAKSKITNETYIVDADINKFWSWMNPGFFELRLSTEISTNIIIKNKGEIDNFVISVKKTDSFQAGTDSSWLQVIDEAFNNYLNEVKNSNHLRIF